MRSLVLHAAGDARLLVEKVVPLDDVPEGALLPMVHGTARGKILVDTQAGVA
jgi:hypothetical protein